jgi:hypothetical protein
MSASRSLDDGSLTPASAAAADTLEMASAAQANASDVPMVAVDKPLLGGDDDDDGTVSLEEGRKQQLEEERKRGTNNSRTAEHSDCSQTAAGGTQMDKSCSSRHRCDCRCIPANRQAAPFTGLSLTY